MSLITDLTAVLRTVCPRVHPDEAPFSSPRPYIIYQGIGGRALYWLNGTPADKRHNRVQITVWGESRIEVDNLIKQIEAALVAAPPALFTARPESEPFSDKDGGLYSAQQDFYFYSPR